MLDKNLVAFVRVDARTITVTHGYSGGEENPTAPSPKRFTYITVLPDVEIDDVVIVYNAHGLALAKVVEVDDDVKIEPNAETRYAWAVAKVDMDAIIALQAENDAIEQAMQQQYAQNMRRSYRQQVLSGLPPEALALLPKSVTGDMPAAPSPSPSDIVQ